MGNAGHNPGPTHPATWWNRASRGVFRLFLALIPLGVLVFVLGAVGYVLTTCLGGGVDCGSPWIPVIVWGGLVLIVVGIVGAIVLWVRGDT